ncbi:MAG: 3-methyl-2-oxobutanoate hydroxymethyltransferase [Candidatus Omnitrophota bacterium]|nr:3-methyl-2-oxobutanoate hydroxymethyltransferase [Candidatus Omnitrophota bacterium]
MTIPELLRRTERGEKLTMLTAYDLPVARLLDEAGVDVVLVGDSLGMVALGYSATVPVTMEEMLHHCKAVRRGVTRALVVGDMPFMSFNIAVKETVRNAGRFLKEAGCDAVKVEGGQGSEESLQAVQAIVQAGIPVLGHLGLTPQTAGRLGGFKVQGKTAETAVKLLESALELESAGCFGVVLECVPTLVAQEISRRLKIPTFGIGAGPHCDGQVLVTHDLLNLTGSFHPKFARAFARLDREILSALSKFKKAVKQGTFPSAAESTAMDPEQAKRFKESLRGERE